MDYSLPGSSVHGILHGRILEWVAMPSSRGSSCSRDRTYVSSHVFADGFFTISTIWEALKKKCCVAEEMGSIHGESKAPTTKLRLKNQAQTVFEPMTFSL